MDKEKKNNKTIIIVLSVLAVILAAVLFITFSNKKSDKFTISFDSDGGTEIASIQVDKNSLIVFPQDPEKEGYTFMYWSLYDQEVTNGYIVCEDITLKAVWQENDELPLIVMINFNCNGGSTIDDMYIEAGSSLVLPENPEKDGYTFLGWNDENGNEVVNGYIVEGDMVLYANWVKNETASTPTNPSTPPSINTNVSVTSISLDKSSISLIVGNTASLKVTVSPSNATNKSVTFTSSDSSIIKVDNNGNLTAVGLGTATITATSSNGKTATCSVTSSVESISISVSNKYISKYGSAVNSTVITVSVSPAVDESLITMSAPDASGSNSVCYTNTNENTATSYKFYARDNWYTDPKSVNVTITVGNKSETVTFYVEPELKLSFEGASSVSGNSVTVESDTTLVIQSSTNTSFSYSSGLITGVDSRSNDRKLYLQIVNKASHPDGFQVTATSKAGQVQAISITVNAKAN